jgi:uncharacterized protein YuzE
MQLTYDTTSNIAYLRLKRRTGKVRTVSVSADVNVDLAPDGSVYGIELLNANVQLNAGRSRKITLSNATSGETCELHLAV